MQLPADADDAADDSADTAEAGNAADADYLEDIIFDTVASI